MYISEYGNWIIEKEELDLIFKGELEDPRSIFAKCGTTTGRAYHNKFNEEMCIPCRNTREQEQINRRIKYGHKKRVGFPQCGKVSGYQKHIRDGTETCQPCRDAHNEAEKTRKRELGITSSLDDHLKCQDMPYTDWFNASFLGTMTNNIKNRFDFWSSRKVYKFSKLQINEYHNQHWNCWYCKEHLLNKVIHVDHRLPVSRGGRNEIENLVLTCAECNIYKRDKTSEEFLKLNN